MEGAPEDWPALPCIGRPWDNARIYVLDRHLQQTPIGVSGELVIGGAQVSRGYLNRPGATAEKFVPDPYAKRPGARMYRTGDIARYRADGNIEYLGRADNQVKVRGFRVELGEIESALLQHPGVREAAAVVRQDNGGPKQVVAYVVADRASNTDHAPRNSNSNTQHATRNTQHASRLTPHALNTFSLSGLRESMQSALPSYMVPSAYVVMDALPLNRNGKVDRLALPAPDASAAGDDEEKRAPSNPIEEVLAEIWSKLLQTEFVGVNQNFFAIGGHSLLAAQVVSRIRDVFRVELPVRALFEHATILELARFLVSGIGTASVGGDTPIPPADRTGPVPLSFAQERLWFMEQLNPGTSLYNLPMAARLAGPLDADSLERAFVALVERHEVLRTVFGTVEEQPVQRLDAGIAPRLSRAELDLQPGEDEPSAIERAVLEEARQPFDLRTGPVIRASLIRVRADDHVLALTLHHIAATRSQAPCCCGSWRRSTTRTGRPRRPPCPP